MSEIVPASQPSAPVDLGYLQEYAKDLTSALSVAKAISNTSFTPAHFRGKPEDAATAMLYGAALGLNPIHALKSIYTVHGAPALYADSMLAIAQAAGHEVERVEATPERVVYRARRWNARSKSFGEWQEVVWSIDRARQAGYTSNKKYMQDPIGMLTAKCKSESARLVAADVIRGLYAVEDMELEPVEEPVKARKTIQRKRVKDDSPDGDQPASDGVVEDSVGVQASGSESGG